VTSASSQQVPAFVFVSRAAAARSSEGERNLPDPEAPPVSAGARSYRWASNRPLRLWVEPRSSLAGWTPRHLALVNEAVRSWTKAPDVRIEYVNAPYEADIRLRWSNELPATNPGLTLLYRSRGERLRRADVYVNVVPPCWNTGTPDRVLYAIIAHELGHALGLAHDPDYQALMHAAPIATTVTEQDLARLATLLRGG
jgi:predicted Zn-dependent protease